MGAGVAEHGGLLDLLDLSSWPKPMRVVIGRERAHRGARLRIAEVDGQRITAFDRGGPPAGLSR